MAGLRELGIWRRRTSSRSSLRTRTSTTTAGWIGSCSYHPDVKVAAHVAAAAYFGGEPAARLGFYERWLAETGMPAPLVEVALEGLRRLARLEPEAAVDTWLQDGDLLTGRREVARAAHAGSLRLAGVPVP